MKQNDWIISGLAIVLSLIVAGVAFGTKREPVAPSAPTQANLTDPTLPTGDVVMTANPGAGGNAAGRPGGFGAPGGFGGPPGGIPGMPGGFGPAGGRPSGGAPFGPGGPPPGMMGGPGGPPAGVGGPPPGAMGPAAGAGRGGR